MRSRFTVRVYAKHSRKHPQHATVVEAANVADAIVAARAANTALADAPLDRIEVLDEQGGVAKAKRETSRYSDWRRNAPMGGGE